MNILKFIIKLPMEIIKFPFNFYDKKNKYKKIKIKNYNWIWKIKKWYIFKDTSTWKDYYTSWYWDFYNIK